jgi:hypothetical protein
MPTMTTDWFSLGFFQHSPLGLWRALQCADQPAGVDLT